MLMITVIATDIENFYFALPCHWLFYLNVLGKQGGWLSAARGVAAHGREVDAGDPRRMSVEPCGILHAPWSVFFLFLMGGD